MRGPERDSRENASDLDLRFPRLLGLNWNIWMPGVLVAFAVGFVLSHDSQSRIVFGLGFAAMLSVLAIVVWSRHARGGQRNRLSLTTEGLQTPLWRLEWVNIESVAVGEVAGQRTLDIEPFRLSDIATDSRFLALNLRLSELVGKPPIRLPASILDRPIEDAIAAIETAAGRNFHRQPDGPM